jgi:hypothetical protein
MPSEHKHQIERGQRNRASYLLLTNLWRRIIKLEEGLEGDSHFIIEIAP